MKKVIIVLVALIGIYLILALVGPSGYKISKTTKIAAPIDVVYNQTSIYANWAGWSPWSKLDPNAKYSIENDNQTIGAVMSWDGDPESVGKGSMTTTKIEPNKTFLYDLAFISPWEMTSHGGFNYTQEGDSVLVEWFDEGEFGFMSRPMMLFMDMEEQIGPQFEQGLADLKKICEAVETAPAIDISQVEVTAQTILYTEEATPLNPDSIKMKIGNAYGEIMALMSVAQIDMTGAPLAITTEFSLETMFWRFNAAIPANYPSDIKLDGRIKAGTTYAGKAVKGVHIGDYMNSMNTYNAIEKYIKDNGLEFNGEPWEEYVDDPTEVKVEELKTNIYFPIK